MDWKKHRREGVLLRLDFYTPADYLSTALGFAPFGTMPVLRRAPFVGLAVWPGGHENPWRPSDSPSVSLADMHHELPREVHDRYWRESIENKKAFLDGQREGAAAHDVTFCLRPDPAVMEYLSGT